MDTIELNGRTFKVEIEQDMDSGAPWENEEGHGIVSEWVTRGKRPSERILCSDRNSKRFYDFAESVKIAKKDGWGAEPYGQGTRGEQTVRAVEADYKYLRAWCDNEWHYVGITVALLGEGGGTGYRESLWGIEDSEHEYLKEVATELAAEILHRVEADAVMANIMAMRQTYAGSTVGIAQ